MGSKKKPRPSPFDMCKCGWTRVQHCATKPHPCTHPGCYCRAFSHCRPGDQDWCSAPAIRNKRDLKAAKYTRWTGLQLP